MMATSKFVYRGGADVTETRHHPDDRALIDSETDFSDIDIGQVERPSWRNPSFAIRVFLVAVVCFFPGLIAGQLANIVTHLMADSSVAAVGGAVLFAFFGGVIEMQGE